jgi:hypothetical protein
MCPGRPMVSLALFLPHTLSHVCIISAPSLTSALQFLARGCVECARTVFSQLLAAFASSQTLWIKAVQLEKQHGTRSTLDAILAQAVQACPQSDTLWLMGAKEKWLAVRFLLLVPQSLIKCWLPVACVGFCRVTVCFQVFSVSFACTFLRVFEADDWFVYATGTQEG